MTVGLAEVVDRAGDGPYRHVNFSREQIKEIRYAGLLHDFGKVGVREQVLVKAKKLYPPDLSLIRSRYAFIKRSAEAEYHRRRADYLAERGRAGYDEFLAQLDAAHRKSSTSSRTTRSATSRSAKEASTRPSGSRSRATSPTPTGSCSRSPGPRSCRRSR